VLVGTLAFYEDVAGGDRDVVGGQVSVDVPDGVEPEFIEFARDPDVQVAILPCSSFLVSGDLGPVREHCPERFEESRHAGAAAVGREEGVEIMQVVDGSPAARAGIRSGDLIVELDGVPITDARDLQRLMVGEVIGRSVEARVWRDGSLRSIVIHPVELTAA
jgi:membrane-associated protease RseP (regulator of RpoE activity)